VVAVTDGEASHPNSTVFSQARLAAIRREETRQALKRLGLADIDVVHLGQPDGRIDEQELCHSLTALLKEGDWCFATWRGDGHPDHEAVGRAAAAACDAVGARLWEYPVWMWHWASPASPPWPAERSVPWHRARRIPLTVEAQARKAEAIAAFESQVAAIGPAPGDAAILPPWVLGRFDRPFEVVFG
jgi:LmbE family N-acetylglucosaminyl deacetylase